MPLKTLIACTIAGAAAGAAASSVYLSSSARKDQHPLSTKPPGTPFALPSSSTTSSAPHPSALPNPADRRSLPIPGPAPVDPAGLFAYGFPGPASDVRHTPSLVSAHNRATRNPHWVAEHITPESLKLTGGDRRSSTFYEDPSQPAPFRAKLADYHGSGFDRGHQVPAADAKWSQEAMDATFALSNMCPQVGEGFNRDYWAHFEDFVRRLTHRYPSVRVVTGPLYLPEQGPDGKWRVSYQVLGDPPNTAVPTHFYKVIFGEHAAPIAGPNGSTLVSREAPVALGAFVLPNATINNDRSLGGFEVPVEIVERATGLEFARLLPKERRRKLCQEVACEIMVKEYADRQRSFGKGASGRK